MTELPPEAGGPGGPWAGGGGAGGGGALLYRGGARSPQEELVLLVEAGEWSGSEQLNPLDSSVLGLCLAERLNVKG